MTNRLILCAVLGAALIHLNACTPAVIGAGAYAANKYHHENQTDFAAQNYAVADYLYQQAQTFIKPKHIVSAQPLTNLDSPEIKTKLDQIIPEQIGVRLSQLGYKIDLSAVSTTADTEILNRGESEADFLLTGNYIRNGREMDVKTRIIDIENKRVVATFDYTTRLIGDVGAMSKPITRIERISE